jgi:hypothetical protein
LHSCQQNRARKRLTYLLLLSDSRIPILYGVMA